MYHLKPPENQICVKETASLFAPSKPLYLPDDLEDNTSAGLELLMRANELYREQPWPEPFAHTSHQLHLGDARNLSFIKDVSIDLVVTSPPYWTLKQYEQGQGSQLGDIEQYEHFLDELDKVWRECARVLKTGGRICCVVGDVCISRKSGGRHHIMPLHADIQVRARKNKLDCLTPVLWHKIANGVTEVKGNGAGFYGKPYQPGAILKNDIEYILFMRKGGAYRKPTTMQKALSMLTKQELDEWMHSVWTDIRGASTKSGHPAPYPVELAERLIRMFSFAGDTILDPFLGTGSTSIATVNTGRNSIGVEIEPKYLEMAGKRIRTSIALPRCKEAVRPMLLEQPLT